jgi:hypothetical protein
MGVASRKIWLSGRGRPAGAAQDFERFLNSPLQRNPRRLALLAIVPFVSLNKKTSIWSLLKPGVDDAQDFSRP